MGVVTQRARVLIAGNNAAMRAFIREALPNVDATEADHDGLLDWLAAEVVDIVVLEDDGKPSDGLTILREVKRRWPELEVVVLGRHESTPLEAMLWANAMTKAGAFGSYDHSFAAFAALEANVLAAVEERRQRRQAVLAREDAPLDVLSQADAMVAPATRELCRQLEQDGPLHLVGERGSGKTFFAELAHLRSTRAHHPFVALDLAGEPTAVLDRLFGTVAVAGLLELASGGTVYLRHAERLSESARKRLAWAIDQGELRREGSRTEIKVDVRVIFGSEDGALPSEFGVAATLVVPALRERRGDIRPLLRALQARSPERPFAVADSLIDALSACRLPGNVTELQAIVAALASKGLPEAGVSDLPPAYRAEAASAGALPMLVEELAEHHSLSKREREFLSIMARESVVQKQASALMHAQPDTGRKFARNILRKTGAPSIADLVCDLRALATVVARADAEAGHGGEQSAGSSWKVSR